MFSYVLDIHGFTDTLASSALHRLHSGFRPTTAVQYNRMFREFLGVPETVHISTHQVNTVVIVHGILASEESFTYEHFKSFSCH